MADTDIQCVMYLASNINLFGKNVILRYFSVLFYEKSSEYVMIPIL